MLVVGIDGTGPELLFDDNNKYRIDNKDSHVANLCALTGGIYFCGPRIGGGGTQFTVDTILTQLTAWAACYPSDSKELEIVLAGHSRGGLEAIMVANQLNAARRKRRAPTRLANSTPATIADIRIRCLALFDAVDRYVGADTGSIPQNVPYCYHAVRNPAVRSRGEFGTTARTVADSSATNYVERQFWVTHAGCGGTPWTGDHPTQIVGWEPVTVTTPLGTQGALAPILKATITEDQDRAGSAMVRSWMTSMLSLHGVFGGTDLFKKGATDFFARSQRYA